MPYDYRTIKDQYDMLADAGIVSESLPAWSARKNAETGTDAYNAGYEDNFIKRASVGIDRFLESTGLPTITEPIGRYAGKALEAVGLEGAEEEGAAFGRKLPRIAANYAPMALMATPLAPLGIAATAGLSGSEAYTETGSPAAGIIAGATNVVMPGVANMARQYALKKMGANLIEGQVVGGVDKLLAKVGLSGLTGEAKEAITGELAGKLATGATTGKIKEYVPKNILQGLAAGGVELGTASALNAVGGIAGGYMGGPGYEFSPTTELLNMTVGQLPFAAHAMTKRGLAQYGGRAAREHEARLNTSIELSGKAIEQHRLNEEQTAKTDIEVPVDTPEQIAAREARTTKLVDLRERQRVARADGSTVAEEERQKLADEDNATLREQGALPGHIMGVPVDSIAKRPILEGDDPVIKLNTAEQQMAAAKDNVDFQDAITGVNDVRTQYGLKPLDDAEISLRQRQFNLGSDRDSVQSHIDETRRLATAKEEGQALKVEVDLKKAELLHEDPMVRASAMARLDEIGAESDKVDNARFIAHLPLTQDNAPIKGFLNEQALKISESTPELVPGDQQKFLDWASGGITSLMRKHAMDADTAANWINDNPVVASWRSRLELQVRNGLPLQDYAERYLMNQGVLEEEAKRQASLVTKLSDAPDLKGGLLATPTEGAEAKKAFADMNTALANDPKPSQDIFAENKVTNADELYNKFVGTGKIDEATLVNLDGKVSDYIYAKAREHQQLANVLHAAETTKYVNGPVESPAPLVKSLGDITDIAAKQARQSADVMGIQGIAPKTLLQNILSGEYNPEWLGTVGKEAQRLKDAFKTPAWLAKVSAHLAEFVSKGHELSPNIRKMAFEAYKAFGMDEKGRFDKDFIKAVRDKQVTGALSKWIGINQRLGAEEGVVVVSPDHPEVARALEGLSPEKQEKVKELMARQEISTKTMQQQELGKMREIYATEGTAFLGGKTGLKYDQNLRLSGDMLDVLQTDWQNPEAAMKGQATLERLQMQFADKPEVFSEFQRVMGEKVAEWDEKKAFFDKNPAWATDKRYGKYNFTYRKGNKTVLDSADSRAEAREIAAGNQIISIEPNVDHADTPVSYERDIPIEQADARWFNNHATWLNKNATYWSRALYRAQSKALLADPELSQRPDILRFAKQHSDNMLSSDPTFGSMANKIASTWYLGWNAASAMVNSTQLVTRGAAEMSKLTGNPIESIKRITSAYKEMYDMWMPGAKGLTEEKQKIVNRLERDGITTVTAEMFGGAGEDSGVELKRALAGRGALQSVPGNLARVYKDTGMKMFQMMERVNNIGAVFAAYDYYRGQKDATGKQVGFEDAYQRALQFNQAVNDVGGKANRPINLMSGTGEVSKSLGLMATSLQTYNIGSIVQIMSYIRHGKFDPPNLTPGEKYHYKTALAHLLVTQALAAGALGVPFVSSVLAVAHQAWPSLEIEKKFREGVYGGINQFMKDDEDDGHIIADIAMGGIPSMFGWDLQSRLSMGNPLAGVSEINGIQPQLLIGTPYELVAKFIKGGVQMATGAPPSSYVNDMVPPFAQKLIDLARGNGKLLDYTGKPIIAQPTLGEKTGMFLGFQPTRLSAYNKANRMKTRAEAASRDATHQFTQDLAAQLEEKGNFGDVKNALKAKQAEELQAGREFDVKDAATQVANARKDLHFPRDLMAKLSEKDARIAQMFPLPLNKPSVAEEANFYAETLRDLGVPYKTRDMAKYQLMDKIDALNPGAYTRAELRRQAEKLLGKVKPANELL